MGIHSIPWWGKIGTKIVLSRLPFGYSLWQRLGLFRHGDMDSAAYALSVFDNHIDRAGIRDSLKGRTIVELGPGDGLATAAIAAAFGARAILVDTGDYANKDLARYLAITESLRKRGLETPDFSGCSSFGEFLNRCGARYLTNGLESLRQLPAGAADLVFSHAVLEHVRKKDFGSTLLECRRLLKPGAAFSNQVDLKDHLGGALDNLRFSERVWESDFFSRSGFYTNRIQFSAMLAAFNAAGFSVESVETANWMTLPTPRKKLDPEFRELPDSELCISSFSVLLR